MGLFYHLYSYAETYVVLFAWITVPLAFYAAYLFLNHHYRIFEVSPNREPGATHPPVKEDLNGTH